MTKAQIAEQTEAREKLRSILKPGDTIYTVLRHVSSSGMSRNIDVFAIDCTEGRSDHVYLSGWVATALGMRRTEQGAIKVGGCGMDMGFHIVHNLGYALYGSAAMGGPGFTCTGKNGYGRNRCPSNDHVNSGPQRDDYTPHTHSEGGYAFHHEWI